MGRRPVAANPGCSHPSVRPIEKFTAGIVRVSKGNGSPQFTAPTPLPRKVFDPLR
jgi:hypothetical protein